MEINTIQSSVQNLTSSFVLNASQENKLTDTSNIEKKASPEVAQNVTQQPGDKALSTQTPANIDSMLNGLNEQLQTLQSFMKFEKDEDNQKMVFFIKNTETGETIRQIPNQELLTISKNISNYLEAVQQSSDLSGKPPSPVGLLTSQTA